MEELVDLLLGLLWTVLVLVVFYLLIHKTKEDKEWIKKQDGKRKKEEEAKRLMEIEMIRNFRINVTGTFWGRKVEFIQREKPLTDEELKTVVSLDEAIAV